jgi:hypothetical protein
MVFGIEEEKEDDDLTKRSYLISHTEYEKTMPSTSTKRHFALHLSDMCALL